MHMFGMLTCMILQAEKDMAKARMDVAHEVRLAKEAEAEMDLHVNKAAEKAEKFEKKYPVDQQNASRHNSGNLDHS